MSTWLALAATSCQKPGPPLHAVYRVDTDAALERRTDQIAIDLEMVLEFPIARVGRYDLMVPVAEAPRIRTPLVEIGRDTEKAQVRFTLSPELARRFKEAVVKETADELRARMLQLGARRCNVTVDGEKITIDVVGLPRGLTDRAHAILRKQALLEFRVVDESGNDWMKSIAASAPAGVRVKTTEWAERDSSREHTMVYYEAASREALDRFFDTQHPPAQNVVACEQISDGSWHAMLLVRRPALTGDALVDADVGWDQQTSRPEVNITFDQPGTRRITWVSERNIGRKLAIMLDGVVKSEPIIESKLGERIRITLGSYGDPLDLQQDAKELAGVLKVGSLPAPIEELAFVVSGP